MLRQAKNISEKNINNKKKQLKTKPMFKGPCVQNQLI